MAAAGPPGGARIGLGGVMNATQLGDQQRKAMQQNRDLAGVDMKDRIKEQNEAEMDETNKNLMT